jgi:hypothetical protein
VGKDGGAGEVELAISFRSALALRNLPTHNRVVSVIA